MASLILNRIFQRSILQYTIKPKLCKRTCNEYCCPTSTSNNSGSGTMEAVVFDGEALTVTHRTDFPKPQIKTPDDVIVKIEYAGVCGTDIHIIKGEFPARKSPPFPMGHESTGVIEAVGEKCVFKPGQKVAIGPATPCDLCDFCRSGAYQHCLVAGFNSYVGIYKDGGWAEYLLVPQQQIYVLPEGLSTQQAGLAEPISCVVHTMNRASPLKIGQQMLVLGAGIIGNLFSSAVHYQGHRNVTICEKSQERMELAKKLDTGFRLIQSDVLEKEKKLYDVIIDCTGVGQVMESCFNYLQRGGKYVVFGCCPQNHHCKLTPYEFFEKEITIVGVKMNPYTFGTAINWIHAMGDRYLDYNRLGVKTFRLKEYEAALKELQSGSISKAMFKLVD